MIGVVVLAAGASRRLGQSKQLIKYKGQYLLNRTIESVSSLNTLVVVLGFDALSHQKIVPPDIRCIINTNWESGMGSSIKTGVKALLDNGQRQDSILITVCDQPYLTQAHIKRIKQAHQSNPYAVVASTYNGAIGVPVLFPIDCFEELLEIDDSSGANQVVKDYDGPIKTIPFINGEIDIDVPEDLRKLGFR